MLVKLKRPEFNDLVDDMKQEYGEDYSPADVPAHLAVERLIAQIAFQCRDCALALVAWNTRTEGQDNHVHVSTMMGSVIAAVALGGAHLCDRWREGVEEEGTPEILE